MDVVLSILLGLGYIPTISMRLIARSCAAAAERSKAATTGCLVDIASRFSQQHDTTYGTHSLSTFITIPDTNWHLRTIGADGSDAVS